VRTVMLDVLPQVDFVIHGGDISYADDRNIGRKNSDTYNEIYDLWGSQMLNITSSKPYMVCPGNHEPSCHSYGNIECEDSTKNFSYYRKRWRMPQNGVENMWYSWDWGFVHFISLSSETDYPGSPEGSDRWLVPDSGPFGDQLTWLENDLKGNKKPWTLVYAHRPMRSSINAKKDWPIGTAKHTEEAFQPLFDKYGVDLYVAGHKHAYERLWPMKGGNVTGHSYTNISSLVQITSGAAGSLEGHDSTNKVEDFIAYRNSEDWGVSTFKWVNKTTLQVQFITEDREVKDSFVITKPLVTSS